MTYITTYSRGSKPVISMIENEIVNHAAVATVLVSALSAQPTSLWTNSMILSIAFAALGEEEFLVMNACPSPS